MGRVSIFLHHESHIFFGSGYFGICECTGSPKDRWGSSPQDILRVDQGGEHDHLHPHGVLGQQHVKADLLREYDQETVEPVESGVKTDLDDEVMDASSGKAVRDPKFMVYWLTTTKSYTSTSYTLTYSVLSVACTPSGWPYSLCG